MNVIDIAVSSDTTTEIEIYHNNLLVQNMHTNSLPVRIHIDLCNNTNTFTIKNISDQEIAINHFSMFNLGNDKLKYLGTVNNGESTYFGHIITPGASWSMQYNYPVFSWLHTTLNFGWLIQSNKVE